LGIKPFTAELERFGFQATFFVEALAHRHFGLEGLRQVCGEIRGRGHDVQLHLHPNYRRMAWRATGAEPLPSLLSDYTLAQQVELIEEGLEALERCGVPRSSLTAFRAGDYAASEATWAALRECGLRLDSSYNLCHRAHGCAIAAATEYPGPFVAGAELVEVPITAFQERRGGYRHLQLSAVSLREMIRVLRDARAQGLRAVTLVTHPFEWFHSDPRDPGQGWPNRVTWSRLRGLLAYLDAHRSDFTVSTLGGLSAADAQALCRPAAASLVGSAFLRHGRNLEQLVQAASRWMELACAS
jgi:hypothetical protein